MKYILECLSRSVVFLTLFLSFSMISFGQGYLVHRYSETNGMPGDTVYDIAQDPQGRMWFATRVGLAVYDGVSWEKHTVSEGLPTQDFFKIKIDQKGRIWALADSGQGGILVTHYDGVQWNPVIGPGNDAFKLSPITSFALLDQPGQTTMPTLAVGTADQGIALRTWGKWHHINQKNGLLSNAVNGIVAHKGKFYAATDNGLSIITPNLRVDNQLNQTLKFPSAIIKGIAVHHKDKFPGSPLQTSRIWLYGEDWLGYVEEKTSQLVHYPLGMLLSGKRRVVNILPDYRCGVYVGDHYLLNYFNYKTGSWESLDTHNNLIGGGANALHIDFEKNIWIACDRGVSKISSRRFTNFQRVHGLFEDEVTSILEYEPGKFILGHNIGITLYDGKKFLQVPFPRNREPGLPVCRVLDMQMDARNNIWLAASWGGLAKINPRYPRIITWYGTAHGLPEQITCLWIHRPTHQVWLGTDSGLFLLTPGPLSTQKKEFVLTRIREFPAYDSRRIYGDSGKLRYIASFNQGVFIYDEGKNQWKNYRVPDNELANAVYSIKKDSKGRLFIGTLAGLFILEKGNLKKFTSNGFQVDRPVYFILEDNNHHLWLGTHNGVVRWDGKTGSTYSIAEGLIGQETNRTAGIVDSKGRIWIGTNRGLSIYDENFDNNEAHIPSPRVRLLYMKVSDKKIPLTPGEYKNKPIRLGHGENTIMFHFRGISFLDETAIRFKNKLEGFDKDWSEETYPYKQIIQYTNLSPGTYYFHLKARNALGVWSEVVSSPKIVIMRPFYQTWWFFVLMVLVVVSVLYAGFLFFTQKRYAALLENQIEERTRQLQAAQQQLIQAQKMEAIGTLAGGIAHDFNNILGAIMGYTELVLEDAPPGTQMQQNLQSIFNATQRAADLVKQILAFSRRSKQQQKPLILSVIVKESLKLLRSSLPATIEIRQHIHSDTGVILGDATQIHQVMMNLATNAAHAMRETGGILEVELQEVYKEDPKPGPYLQLTVSDTGHGMTPDIMKRIFEPYFTTKKTGEGTGMGLAVIHGIVKSHNGDISVYSEPGKGTTFHVFFPKIEEKEEPETQAKPEIPGGSERIMLVDDETALAETGSQILERLGYKVVGISNAIEALETFRKTPHQFHLVISDLTMPHMTGIQLAEEIKKINPDIPFILCSGFSAALTIAQIKELGISDFVMKPIVKSELAQTIRRVLDNRSS